MECVGGERCGQRTCTSCAGAGANQWPDEVKGWQHRPLYPLRLSWPFVHLTPIELPHLLAPFLLTLSALLRTPFLRNCRLSRILLRLDLYFTEIASDVSIRYCTCLVLCSATSDVSEIPQISASKISLCWPRLILISCHSSRLQFVFHTTAAPVPPVSSFDPSHQSFRSYLLTIPSRIASSLPSIISFPGKANLDEAKMAVFDFSSSTVQISSIAKFFWALSARSVPQALLKTWWRFLLDNREASANQSEWTALVSSFRLILAVKKMKM